MDSIKASSNTINKAQIGKYASQGISTLPGERAFELKRIYPMFVPQTFIRRQNPGTLKFSEPINAEVQIFGKMLLISHFKKDILQEKVTLERRNKSPRMNRDFMDLVEELQDIWDKIPEEELKKIPSDASEKIDSYLYGKPE